MRLTARQGLVTHRSTVILYVAPAKPSKAPGDKKPAALFFSPALPCMSFRNSRPAPESLSALTDASNGCRVLVVLV